MMRRHLSDPGNIALHNIKVAAVVVAAEEGGVEVLACPSAEIAHAAKSKAATVNFTVPPLKGGANYQIRARVIVGPGLGLGQASDPLVVRVD